MLHVSLSEAFRQLKNNKLNSAVNIIGIAFALTIIALIGLYVVLYWCYKAATRNPITILKNE